MLTDDIYIVDRYINNSRGNMVKIAWNRIRNVNDKIWKEIIKAFDNLGADTEFLCNIGSINDTLSDDEILQNLIDYNNGLRMTVIEEFDAGILKDAEQASKRNFHKSKIAQNSTKPNTGSTKLLDRLEEIIDVARWVSVNNYTECKEIIQQLRT